MTFTDLCGLKDGINTQRVALFNLLRQVGGMIDIAALQTSLDTHKMMARTSLSTNIVDGQPILAERVRCFDPSFAKSGAGSWGSGSKRLGAVIQEP
jgi:hypothetical protein